MSPRPENPAPGGKPAPEEPPPRPPRRVSAIGLIGVGTIFASMVLSGFLLGYWTDVWLDTRPVFMLFFAGLGLIGGLLKVYRLLT